MGQTILTRGQRSSCGSSSGAACALIANAIFLLLFRVTESTERFKLPNDTLPGFYQCDGAAPHRARRDARADRDHLRLLAPRPRVARRHRPRSRPARC
jgi:hypothetical protein